MITTLRHSTPALLLCLLVSFESAGQWVSHPVPRELTMLLSVDFSGFPRGVASGYGSATTFRGGAMYSANGGNSWFLSSVPDSARSLVSLQMFPEGLGYIAGAYNSSLPLGKLRVDGAGAGRSKVSALSAGYFRRIGLDAAEEYSGLFLKTTDFGQTWSTWGTLPDSSYYLLGLSFTDRSTGYVTAATTPGVGKADILKTTNGGLSWTRAGLSDSIVSLPSIRFATASLGVSVGYRDSAGVIAGVILRTANAGVSWEQSDFPQIDNFTAVSFSSSSIAYASGVTRDGEGVVYKTTNAGMQWSALPVSVDTTILEGITFAPGSSTGIIYGVRGGQVFSPYVARTTDGGSTWSMASLPSVTPGSLLYSGYLVNPDVGHVVGGMPFVQAVALSTVNGGITFASAGDGRIPQRTSLRQNYPNPFNPVTAVSFQLAVDSRVKLAIYDLLGQEVAVLVDGAEQAGIHTVQWNAKGLASGVYFCRFWSGTYLQTMKLVLQK